MNTTNSARLIAPPPPPAKRGLISGAFLASILAALFLTVAAPSAEAQTVTLSATGDRDPNTPGIQVDEGDTITIALTLSEWPGGTVFNSVRSFFEGTAENRQGAQGQDFTGPTGTDGDGVIRVNYAPRLLRENRLSENLSYTITSDNIAEPDETIILAVPMFIANNVESVTRGPDLTVTIRANDQPVFDVAAGSADTAEGQTAEFTVTLRDTAPTGAVTVGWDVGGDVSAGDWSSTSARTLSFTALGMQTINIAITADGVREDAETLTVTLRNPSTGSVIGTASATTTIAESDQPHARTLTVTGPSTLTETDGNLETGNYTIALAGTAFPSATTVTWTVTNGTTADADFVAASDRTGTVEFTTTDTSQTFTLTVAGDDLNEAAETFTVQVSVADAAADGGTAYGAAATTTITDDDPITATLPTATVTAAEGGTAAFLVNLTGGTATADVVITYNSADATGSLTIPTGMTTGLLGLTAVDDAVSEGVETLTLAASDFTATSAGVVTVASAATLTINADMNDDITVTIAAPAAANTGQAAEFTVTMSGASAAAVTVAYSVALTVDGAAVMIPAGNITDTVSPIAAGARGGVISVRVPADVNVAQSGSLGVTLTGVTVASGGGTAMLSSTMSEIAATAAVSSDDPAARAARLEAPLAAAARGIGQLAAHAVARRATSAGNNLTLAGRGITDAETIPAALLAGGRETTMKELLRQSGFSFTNGDSGLNFWGGGERINAEGDADGVTYDGGTTAFHLGMDAPWRDGLIGIAAANSAGDLDLTAAGMTSALETNVTSIHPYLVRRLNNSRLWTTLGYGSGDAEIKEPGGVNIKTDLTVLTAAFSIAHATSETVRASVGALYSRATLDAAQSAGRRLPKVAVHALRITAAGEWGRQVNDWRPFATINLRHDAGDGDTGSAGDVGGGVEWQKATASLRLAGTTHLAGDGPEEDRLTFTARKNAGRLNLGLNLGVHNGVDTANLLTGEWRF